VSWRLVIRHLHIAGPATTGDLAASLETDKKTLAQWLCRGVHLEAIERFRLGHYRLSAMGLALIEGRVELVQMRPGGYAWRATWAQPLPRYATKGMT
jgi:hypothetical protein